MSSVIVSILAFSHAKVSCLHDSGLLSSLLLVFYLASDDLWTFPYNASATAQTSVSLCVSSERYRGRENVDANMFQDDVLQITQQGYD